MLVRSSAEVQGEGDIRHNARDRKYLAYEPTGRHTRGISNGM